MGPSDVKRTTLGYVTVDINTKNRSLWNKYLYNYNKLAGWCDILHTGLSHYIYVNDLLYIIQCFWKLYMNVISLLNCFTVKAWGCYETDECVFESVNKENRETFKSFVVCSWHLTSPCGLHHETGSTYSVRLWGNWTY